MGQVMVVIPCLIEGMVISLGPVVRKRSGDLRVNMPGQEPSCTLQD